MLGKLEGLMLDERIKTEKVHVPLNDKGNGTLLKFHLRMVREQKKQYNGYKDDLSSFLFFSI